MLPCGTLHNPGTLLLVGTFGHIYVCVIIRMCNYCCLLRFVKDSGRKWKQRYTKLELCFLSNLPHTSHKVCRHTLNLILLVLDFFCWSFLSCRSTGEKNSSKATLHPCKYNMPNFIWHQGPFYSVNNVSWKGTLKFIFCSVWENDTYSWLQQWTLAREQARLVCPVEVGLATSYEWNSILRVGIFS